MSSSEENRGEGQAHPSQVALPPPTAGLLPCPPGTEILYQCPFLFVRQQMEMFEVLTGFNTNNRYEVLDPMGRRVFFAVENSSGMSRAFMGSTRPFTILLLNQFGGVVLVVQRLVSCCNAMWGGTCGNEVVVETGTGALVGRIIQDDGSCCQPKLGIFDANQAKVLDVVGPNSCCMCYDVQFEIMDNGGNKVGEVHKQWGGMMREMYTTADNFGVSFPPNMDPGTKVILLGVVFLLDFMFFENQPNRGGHHHHHRHGGIHGGF